MPDERWLCESARIEHHEASERIEIPATETRGRPWLRIESGGTGFNVEAAQAVRIRDGLRRTGGKIEERLATIIDAKATELLAAPLYAGTVSVRIDPQERECLLTILTAWVDDGSINETGSDNLRGLLVALER